MARFDPQDGRNHDRHCAQASSIERETAFSQIFGAPPPPGRTQIRPHPAVLYPGTKSPGPGMMHRTPPIRPGQQVNGYASGIGIAVNSVTPNGNFGSTLSHTPPPPPPPSLSSSHLQPHSEQIPPALALKIQGNDGGRRGMDEATRSIGAFIGPSGKNVLANFYSNPVTSSSSAQDCGSDGFRCQSMVSHSRGKALGGAINYSISPAHTFRQQALLANGARSIGQGYGNVLGSEGYGERSLTMTSIPTRELHLAQTQSGRVIPSRFRGMGTGDHYGGETRFFSESLAYAGMSTNGCNESVGLAVQNSHGIVGGGGGGSNGISSNGSGGGNNGVNMNVLGDRGTANHVLRAAASATGLSSSDSVRSASGRLHGGGAGLNSRSSGSQLQSNASQRKGPVVYGALLSRVAKAFRERITLTEKTKDGLEYKNAFTGVEAVDLIGYIIKTQDRNLALLVGRSLDAQKFFHDVTYAHRLRDSMNEVYQFRETLMEAKNEVNGVFTLIADCYSPTCTPFRVCYSISCPRRLEQQARLNIKLQPVLKRQESRFSLHEDGGGEEQKLWINTVSKEIAERVSEMEKKRQEVIWELVYTERDFVKDLEYLKDFWMKPLRSPVNSPIPEHRREKFIRTVFSNCREVYAVNSGLAEALTRRQQHSGIVHNVGDIFLEFVPRFGPFIKYGANQLFGKYEFENEKRSNGLFAKFVEETERMAESRKLELNGYLTKPTTRLARYPLLLENVLKYTDSENMDRRDIPIAIGMIKEFLNRVNIESGKSENHFNLMQLNRELKFKPGEFVDLKLTEESRQLIFKGLLKRNATESNGDIQACLFDHALLLARIKLVNKREELKVFRKPIPLELLTITQIEENYVKQSLMKRPSSGLIPGGRTNTMTSNKAEGGKAGGYPITFRRLGKGGYEITLYCTSAIQQQKWIENIDQQQRNLRDRSKFYRKVIINFGYFNQSNRVNCCVPIDGGKRLIFGTDNGVYTWYRAESKTKPQRILDCKSVTQIDVMEVHDLLLILTEKTLYTYPLDIIDQEDPQNLPGANRRGTKICHSNFFKTGVCQGEGLICCVKTSALSSTIKVFKPNGLNKIASRKGTGLSRILGSNPEFMKLVKEFYIPSESTSIHYLRSKLCVGCTRGFEVVSIETMETQSLLNQADTSLDFVQSKENIRPIHIERVAGEFLLSYSDFSFFVNRNGWRARSEWLIVWEGNPNAFAVFHPYILAFEPCFIEIRHLDTGMLMNILTAKNIRLLHSSSREILYAYEDDTGDDVIASLDFSQTGNTHTDTPVLTQHHIIVEKSCKIHDAPLPPTPTGQSD